MSDDVTEATAHDEVLAGLAGLLEEIAEVPAAQVRQDADLRADLGVDSLAMVELVVAAEELWGLRIADEDARGLRTVGAFADHVRRAQGG